MTATARADKVRRLFESIKQGRLTISAGPPVVDDPNLMVDDLLREEDLILLDEVFSETDQIKVIWNGRPQTENARHYLRMIWPVPRVPRGGR